MEEETMEALENAILNSNVELLKKALDKVSTSEDFTHRALYVAVAKGINDSRTNVARACDEVAFDSIQKKNMEIIQILLNNGANVNFTGNNNFCYSAFAYACRSGNVDIVKMLQSHADFDTTDKYGRNPIQLAFRSGQEAMIELFLNNPAYYAKINRSEPNNQQQQPHGSDKSNEMEIIDLTQDNEDIESIQCKERDNQEKLSRESINRLNLLNYAVSSSTVPKSIVERLVQLGANVNGVTPNGYTVLKCAILGGSLEIIKFLVENGADVNGVIEEKGNSELGLAVLEGNVQIVELLLNCGADIYRGQEYPLNVAAQKGHQEIVKLLLDSGANVQGRDIDYIRPVKTAAYAGQEKIVGFLLDLGATDDELLECAIEQQNCDLVKLLLERGSDPSSYNYHYGTVLIQAVDYTTKSGNYEIINLLLDYGAQIDEVSWPRDLFDRTALTYAVHGCHEGKIVKFLLGKGADINIICNDRETVLEMDAIDCEVLNIFISHIELMKSQNLYISEKNLKALSELMEGKDDFQKRCVKEIELLKNEKFDDSSLFYYDILAIKDVKKLAKWASNENIVRVVKSNDFEVKFPIYGEIIVENIDKGLSRNRDFTLIRKFFDYLSTRKTDKLPKLPFICICMIFDYLRIQDVDKFRRL